MELSTADLHCIGVSLRLASASVTLIHDGCEDERNRPEILSLAHRCERLAERIERELGIFDLTGDLARARAERESKLREEMHGL